MDDKTLNEIRAVGRSRAALRRMHKDSIVSFGGLLREATLRVLSITSVKWPDDYYIYKTRGNSE